MEYDPCYSHISGRAGLGKVLSLQGVFFDSKARQPVLGNRFAVGPYQSSRHFSECWAVLESMA